jgi:hypothetical protein
MKTWVLIVWFSGHSGAPISFHDFYGYEACATARADMQKLDRRIAGVCAPKSNP